MFSKRKPTVERVVILHEGAEPSPGEIRQLVADFFCDYAGEDLHGTRITTYDAGGAASRDLALSLVLRLEREGQLRPGALSRTITVPFETAKGAMVLAGVWRKNLPRKVDDFEVPGNQKPDRRCSDHLCPCGVPGTLIPRGKGYMYIPPEVVNWRRDARTLREAEQKTEKLQKKSRTSLALRTGEFVPTLMCDVGARRRGLDLDVAAADARRWWETGRLPLRATPRT